MPVRWQAQYHAKWQGAQKSFSTLLDSNQGPCWVYMKFLWIVIQLVDFPNKIVELRRTVNLNLGCLFVSVEKATRMVCFSRKCFRRGHWQWHWNTRYNCYDCLWWSQANLFWVFRSFSELYQKTSGSISVPVFWNLETIFASWILILVLLKLVIDLRSGKILHFNFERCHQQFYIYVFCTYLK